MGSETRVSRDGRTPILIVVPVFASVYPSAFKNFLAIVAHAASRLHMRYRFDFHVPERAILHSAMNEAFAAAMTSDYAAVIMFDDDCYPPVDAIPRILEHFEAGHPIVAGAGFMRAYPHTTTVGRYLPNGIGLVQDATTGEFRLTGFRWLDDLIGEPLLVPCDFCGFPIALVSMAAIRKMREPWFGTTLHGGACTHDVYFGEKAKEAALPIVVDRSIECGHLGEAPVITFQTRSFARAMQHAWKRAPVPEIPQEQTT